MSSLPSKLPARGAASLLGLILASCVPDVDDDTSLVTAPRVLAIQAEPPEAGEGDTVSLTALVASDGEAADDAVSYFFCTARKPLSELGPIEPGCLYDTSGARAALGTGLSVSGALDRGVCSLFGPRRPSAEPGQPAGRAADPDATGGFYQPVLAELLGQLGVLGGVRLDCGLPSADREQVIEYNQRHRTNQNPRIDRLERLASATWTPLAEDAAQRVGAGERLELRVSWAACAAEERCTGAEQYVMFDPAGRALVERQEALVASWYATDGRFDAPRTEPGDTPFQSENGWVAPSARGAVRLWVVLRDGRGGVGHASYRLDVE